MSQMDLICTGTSDTLSCRQQTPGHYPSTNMIQKSLKMCLNHCLTVSPINLMFGMCTHIRSIFDIGYMILTFKVFKGHFRLNNFHCQITVWCSLQEEVWKEYFLNLRVLGIRRGVSEQLLVKLKVKPHVLNPELGIIEYINHTLE